VDPTKRRTAELVNLKRASAVERVECILRLVYAKKPIGGFGLGTALFADPGLAQSAWRSGRVARRGAARRH
jgi:hypothetical protein